jgi:nucleoid-associated protein Lsr2
MAQRTQVLLIDDLDGCPAEETLNFGLDGAAYEIDLSGDNAGLLRKALADYVAAGRRVNSSRLSSRRRPLARMPQTANAVDTASVRAWARENGYSVNDRGRIAADILEAYEAAH